MQKEQNDCTTKKTWDRRCELCSEAIKILEKLERKTPAQEAANEFLKEFEKSAKKFFADKKPESGNRKHSINEISLRAGCEVGILRVAYEPTLKSEDFLDKRFDVLVYGDQKSRCVAVECKSTAAFNDVAAACSEFLVARSANKGVFFVASEKKGEGSSVKIQKRGTLCILLCMSGESRWFDDLSKLFFKGKTKPELFILFEEKKHTTPDQLQNKVVSLYEMLFKHMEIAN